MVEPDAYRETHGRANLPTSPKSSCDRPPTSYDNVESAPRRRSGSLTRVRDSLRRKSINLHHRMERKLLEMAESHLEIPLTLSGPRGLMFHVPELPGSHSRESVVDVLHQSLNWLQSNPDQGRTPFTPTDASQTGTPTDLLTPHITCADLPSLQPSPSHKILQMDSVRSTNSHSDRTKRDHDLSATCLNHPVSGACGALIDLEEQPVSPAPVEPQQLSKLKLKHKIHPDLTSLVSYFEQRSAAPPPTTRVTHFRPTHPNGKLSSTSVQPKNERGGPEQIEGKVTCAGTDSLLCPEDKQYTSQVRRKPVTNTVPFALTEPTVSSTPSAFLGVGLRPVPAPTIAVASAPQAGTVCSTRKPSRNIHSIRQAPNPVPQSRTLSRKQNGHDLRTLHLDQACNYGISEPCTNHGDATQIPKHTQLQNRVAEKIDRYENPSLPLLVGDVDLWKTATRTHKRWGMYGPPTVAHQHIDPQKLSQGSCATERGKSERLQQYQPYRPAQRTPDRSASLPKPQQAPPYTRELTLTDKAELFLVPNNGPCASDTVPGSLSQNNDLSLSSGLNSDDQPHHIAHIRSIVRKGTFQQLGGRVVEVRRQFESDKIGTDIGLDRLSARNKSRIMPGHASHAKNAKNADRDQAKPQPLPLDKQHNRHLSNRRRQNPSQQPSSAVFSQSSLRKSHLTPITNTADTPSSPSSQSSKTSEKISPFNPHDPSNPSIYSNLHPDFAQDPQAFQDSMAKETRRRLVAAADESDFARSWKRAVETGRESEDVRKLDFAWQWKRFSDREWNGRDRARMVNNNSDNNTDGKEGLKK